MMNSRWIRFLGCVAVCTVSLGAVAYADWPQLQGPNRDGTSPETGLLRAWPESGPRVLWTTPVGAGYGGAAVYGNEVFVLDRVEEKQDILRCLSLENGTELWRYAYDAPGKAGHSGSRTPPTVDAQHVYSVGMLGHFVCIDRKTHKPVWQKNLLADLGVETPRWGVAQSPYLYKNLVLVAAQGPDSIVLAFDKNSGEVVWKSPSLGNGGYVPPVVATLGGVEQVVMIGASNRGGTERGSVAGLSLKDGAVLWQYEGWRCWIPIAYPTALPGDRLFVTGGYGAGSAMIQIKKGASGFEVAELFKLDAKTCGSQIHQPILYKDHLYVNSNSNERQDGLTCLTLDGTVKWRTSEKEGLPLFERGNLLLADGMLYALDGKTGILHLIDPSPEGYKELARAKLLEGERMWAPMALSDGKLIIRSQAEMKCLDVKRP